MVNCTVFFNFGIYIVCVLLQGIAIEKSNVRLPYSKINEYGISAEGLPEDKELKHPSSYGKKMLQSILDNSASITIKGKTCAYMVHMCQGRGSSLVLRSH